jgi:hypothetical protein
VGKFERDSDIERELHRILDPTLAVAIPAWRAPVAPGKLRRVLGGAAAALTVKVATGLAVAAAAATVAGAAAETAITGSASPTAWGQQVKTQVDECKDALAPGQNGIGECVSNLAKTHSDPVIATQPPAVPTKTAPPARTKGASDGKSDGRGNGGRGNEPPDGARTRPGGHDSGRGGRPSPGPKP